MKISILTILSKLKSQNINIDSKIRKDKKFIGVDNLNNSSKEQITFFHNIKYKKELINTLSGACFISKDHVKYLPEKCLPLITSDPYKAFIATLNIFFPLRKSNGKISKNSIINKKSKIGKNVEIQDGVIIDKNVSIGDNSIISHNTTIDKNTTILKNVIIGSNCSISNCKIYENTIIQHGVIIGSIGFTFAIDDKKYNLMNHLGKVIIGKNSSIGSNSTIARGSLSNTIIGENVRIDNLVHISHNVIIGNGTIIAGQSGIAGSTTIGENVIMGGQVGISGHLKIGNNVKIAAKSGVIKNVSSNSIIGGYPAVKINDWHRSTIKLYSKNKK